MIGNVRDAESADVTYIDNDIAGILDPVSYEILDVKAQAWLRLSPMRRCGSFVTPRKKRLFWSDKNEGAEISTEMLPLMKDAEWVDTARRPYVKGDDAYIPVREGYSADAEIAEKTPYTGRGYQMLGDVALLHGRPPTQTDIDEICTWVHTAWHCVCVRILR